MNTYKFQAYTEIKGIIALLKNSIDEKEAAINQKKNEISRLEAEIDDCNKKLQSAINFKMELEGSEKQQKIDCHENK